MSESDVYTAEKILAKRNNRGKVQYLIKWMNFPRRDSTWEPVENVLDPSLLETFYQERRQKGRRKNGRRTRKSKQETSDSPDSSQSRDRSPTRSPTARNTPNSQTSEPSKLVLDESLESDSTEDDHSQTLEESDSITKSSKPEETVSTDEDLPAERPVGQPERQPISQNLWPRSPNGVPTPKKELHDVHSPIPHDSWPGSPRQSPAKQHLSIDISQQSLKAHRSTPSLQQQSPQTHLAPVVRQPSLSPQRNSTNKSKQANQPTYALQPVAAPPPKAPAKSASHPTPSKVAKLDHPIVALNIQSSNNRQFPNHQNLPTVPPKSRKFAVMNTVITDVTVNDHTITISESKTGHGFFREAGRNSVDATTQF